MKKQVILIALMVIFFSILSLAQDKTFIDYFLSTPINGSLSREIWGASQVGPRDPMNGLEDVTASQWSYWDGQIIKGTDGRYHMFASRWDQSGGHMAWGNSLAVHAVSNNLFGPYVDQGLCWPDNQGGKGHNVTALVLPDGRYAVVVSETRPGDVFVSASLDGPWKHLGQITVERPESYTERDARLSNMSIMVRPDGDFMIVPRAGTIWISKTGILGPYKIVAPTAFSAVEGVPTGRIEDPAIWFSGGLYHIIANNYSARTAYHLTSRDGITGWKNMGLAYDPRKDFVRYNDGTVNHWALMERPGVVIENGHVVAITLAALNVPKREDVGGDANTSKIVVIPFDGVTMDLNLQESETATLQNEGQRQGQREAPRDVDKEDNEMAQAVTGAVAQLPPLPSGPYKPTWESIRENYQYPDWLRDAKFGIYMHWGLYSVPARQSEWYYRHMYGNPGVRNWHIQNFGPLKIFGYKDFIKQFKAEKYDPTQWAKMFRDAGARYVALTAEHHDGFSLWDSKINKRNSVNMGPQRDLIGDLASAVRKEGMIFGVTNHSMENFTFLQPENLPQNPKETTDLYDPEWADFYHVADRSVEAQTVFYRDWVLKNIELIDKYQPSMLWFDNGVNTRTLDPLKLYVAAYYYNRAKEWGKQVTLSTKGQAYLAGSVLDHERQGRAEQKIYPDPWQVDESVHSRWGYLTETNYLNVNAIVWRIVENTSKNGNLLLNFSPLPDGTFNQVQIDLMKGTGVWLRQNGEGIYDTRPWIKYGEGPSCERDQRPNQPPYEPADFRFTRKGNVLYVFVVAWPESGNSTILSLATGAKGFSGKITRVKMLGAKRKLQFIQDAGGLHVTLPKQQPGEHIWTLKIEGLKLEEWRPVTQ